MTRINANIEPADLIDKHLLAEYREIVRIPNIINKYNYDILKTKINNIPKQFKLGTGHVLYFYNKQKFLHKRFFALKSELSKRGIVNNMNDDMFLNIPEYLYNDIPSHYLYNANILIVERIIERIHTMKTTPKIDNLPINIDEYSNKLRNKYNNIK